MATDISIRKQKFKIKTTSEQQAFEVRRIVNDHLQYKLLQVYENALGNLQSDIYADRIVINLGKMTLPEISDQLPQRIKEELLKQLRPGQQLYEIMQDSYVSKMDMQNQFGEPESEKIMQWGKSGSTAVIQTDDVSGIMYFLEKGIYPWWYKQKNRKPAEVLESFSSGEMEKLLIKIVLIIKSDFDEKIKIVKTRIRQQLNEIVFEKFNYACIDLIGNNGARQNIVLLTLKESVLTLSEFFSLSIAKYRQILADYFLDVVSGKKEMNLKDFLLLLKEDGKINFEKNEGDTKNKFSKKYFSSGKENEQYSMSPEIKAVLENLIKSEKDQKSISKYKKQKENETPDRNLLEKKDDNVSITDQKKGKMHVHEKNQKPSDIFTDEEGIYIDNGGIIILHPFLTVLFKELNLLDEKDQFNSADCMERAVVLLHYLQTGDIEYEEQLLGFNKIICGMNPEDNLSVEISLTQNEKSECEQLLDIVIGYWEALKGSSRDALRETFLTRAAKLSFKNEIYLLQVERNATDILIDRLPWGFGIIKFPWLSHLIHVEW